MNELLGQPVRRRSVLAGSAVAGAASVVGAGRADAAASLVTKKKVAVFGGGVAGLTAAHELAERGYQVTVYWRRVGGLGGKARSMGVPGTGAGGRRALPGEHGFRFFPGFYRNLPETMRKIPYADNPDGAYGNLEVASQFCFSRADGPDLYLPTDLPVPADWTPQKFAESMAAAFSEAYELPAHEAAYFAKQVMVFFTSCDARRFGQWEYTSWWEFIKAEKFSVEYQKMLSRGLTRNLAAAKETVASVNAMGTVGEAFAYTLAGRQEGEGDRVLNAPTNEVFIDPWVVQLRSMGVQFREGWELTRLRTAYGRITGAVGTGPSGEEQVSADWYVSALLVERARELWTEEILAADPRLAAMHKVQTDWMTGIQYYLNKPLPLATGHVSYVESQWALTSISQAQFWKHDFAATYGDGSAVDCLSIDISDWETPGLNGKAAWDCTPDEIAAEIWEQVKAHVADEDPGALTDDMLVGWFLDPGIRYTGSPQPDGRMVANEDPLLINNLGSWDDRPETRTGIPNLFLAGDYVRCHIQVATMEAANETGRRAANAVLDASGSLAPRATVHGMYRPPEWETVKALDSVLYAAGQPHPFETIDPLAFIGHDLLSPLDPRS